MKKPDGAKKGKEKDAKAGKRKKKEPRVKEPKDDDTWEKPKQRNVPEKECAPGKILGHLFSNYNYQIIDIWSTYPNTYCKMVVGSVHLYSREEFLRGSKYPTNVSELR